MCKTFRLSRRSANTPPILATKEQAPTAWFLKHATLSLKIDFALGEQSELVMVQWLIKLAKPYWSGEKLSGVEENDGKGSGGPKLPQQGEEHLVRFRKLGIFQIMAFLCFMNWSRIRIWSGSNSTKIHLWRMVAPGALRKLVHGNLGAGYSRCRLAQRPPDSKKQQSPFCKLYKKVLQFTWQRESTGLRPQQSITNMLKMHPGISMRTLKNKI